MSDAESDSAAKEDNNKEFGGSNTDPSSEDEYLPPGAPRKRKAKYVKKAKVAAKKSKSSLFEIFNQKEENKQHSIWLSQMAAEKPSVGNFEKSTADNKLLLSILRNTRSGSDEFMNSFRKLEPSLVGNNNKPFVIRTEDATMETLDRLFNDEGKVIITSDLKKLGFNMPKDFSFETANELLGNNKTKIDVIDSRSGQTLTSTVGEVFTSIHKGASGDRIPNVLSFEVSKDETLGPTITIPTFVKQNSLVIEIDEAFEILLRESSSANQFRLSAQDRNKHRSLREEYEKYQRIVPRYDKYIIFSQAGAYTCLHIDLAGSAVYYYVVQGQKVIYLAEPTKENLDLYRKLELEKKNIWSCEEDVIRRFERHVVNEGEMVIIPPGYLHYVYTPVISLVIGGNYVTRRYLPLHMKMTQLEEKCLKIKNLSRNQMFLHFYEIMYAWLKHVFLPYFEATPLVGRYTYTRDMGFALLHGLEIKKESGSLYTSSEKKRLLEKLKDALNMTGDEKDQCAEIVANKNDAFAIDFSYTKLVVN
uniref:JmjC domain-containing protein n=1 Tax=Caenorhabditis tropicalis TaxID=1561998 RepID=A0A1I7U0P5_9PELO